MMQFKSGRFRGWICHGCNTGVGRNDNPKLLRLRASYLEKPLPKTDIQWAHPNKHKRIAA